MDGASAPNVDSNFLNIMFIFFFSGRLSSPTTQISSRQWMEQQLTINESCGLKEEDCPQTFLTAATTTTKKRSSQAKTTKLYLYDVHSEEDAPTPPIDAAPRKKSIIPPHAPQICILCPLALLCGVILEGLVYDTLKCLPVERPRS
ncbi:uncharacterized protein LOC143362138 [Halictus rubicundus]|uniref:uncharacterized protein LOC143362138 n=1 Tax=Halictus rubicundus TaxID=77578 RepID=UPI004035330D